MQVNACGFVKYIYILKIYTLKERGTTLKPDQEKTKSRIPP